METKEISCISQKVALGVIVLFLLPSFIFTQNGYDPFIDSVISKISLQSISIFDRQLSGDTSALIGGQPYTIISRYWEHEGNRKAAQYIYEKFQSFGYQPQYDTFSVSGVNVLAKKTGTKYPNQYFIICAHYDSYAYGVPALDTVPGADDNASGTSAVLEAARILYPYSFDYTILFAAWDEEERWMYGSYAYADSAFIRGDSIVAVINLDMIGYDGNNDHVYRIWADTNGAPVANIFADAGLTYQPFLVPLIQIGPSASDHLPFQEKGYKAICAIENSPDFNPYYHTVNEKFIHFNLPYFLGLVKTSIAALLVSLRSAFISFSHIPLESTFDTTSRIAVVTIKSSKGLGFGGPGKVPNDPKLFFKVGSGNFRHLIAYYHHLDTFKFLIPGQSQGSTVSYYFAAQDSLGTTVGSLPSGAKGLNPPGTIPPPQLFVYSILKQSSYCSNTIPKTIPPRQITLDTIHIPQNGNIYDYNLNFTIYHTHDSSLYIWLTRPGATMLPLSTANGGSGENYFNTTFDDEASIPITEGVPPFMGSYRPEGLLSSFDSQPMQGDWIIRIYNYSETITGQLASWCLSFEHYDPIGIVNNQIPVKISLSQNYPNPFNSSTKINFSLPKQSHVRIAVYDVLGREVNVIVNSIINYGEHNLSFDANNLASGMYFYSMYINGDLFVTKKMVLIK